MSDLEGVMLSDYLLLQCISKGGLADIYRARQTGEGNYEVAVKVFRSGYAQRESFRNYFMAEAEKIGEFDHPNILPFLEFGEGEGLLYVVSPFVTPGTLEDLLARVGGKFSAMQALPIVQQLCSAVQYAHNCDVIHGNIKPTNVFVATDGRMLLSDFGIARRYDNSQQSLTGVGWGTAEYAAPEQSLGVLRRGSDIYALGVLLFRILTGQPPFTGQTPIEVLLKHVRQPPPPARALAPNISDAVDAVIQRAMQKRSDDRYASAEELSNAFLGAVSVAPVASPVAMLPPQLFDQLVSGGSLKDPQTPVPAFNTSTVSGDPQTPTPAPYAFPPSSFPASKEPSYFAPLSPDGDAAAGGGNLDVTERISRDARQRSANAGKHRFWSVDPDPVEWSPIASAQEGNAVPLTAGAYLRSKPLEQETLPPEPALVPPPSPGEAQSHEGNRFSEGLRKALPIVVVILLLLGLLGALLSSFFFPSDGPGTYAAPLHGIQQTIVSREGNIRGERWQNLREFW
jgi:serine/threonine protein kinase